jgi:hypothetical protein
MPLAALAKTHTSVAAAYPARPTQHNAPQLECGAGENALAAQYLGMPSSNS